MKDTDQIAAEAESTLPLSDTPTAKKIRIEQITSAIDKALKESGKWDAETWKNNFDLAVKKIQELESRAAHASEPRLAKATTEGEERYYVPPTHASEPERSDGWYRVPNAGKDVWHKKGVGFCLTKDLPAHASERTDRLPAIEDRDFTTERAAHASETCILEVDSPVHPAGWDEYLQCGCHRCLDYIRRYILSLEKQPAHASEYPLPDGRTK